ncbi:hypothetical protein GCM10011345_38580 [Gemmobacter megaterium]|nr:hypothetical protein GCM10011345_38580 [Gemmobacter megaterium]
MGPDTRKVTDPSRLRRSLTALRPFAPVIGRASLRDVAAGGLGLALGLLICSTLLFGMGVDLASGAFLIAPMGATAVLLFAVPNSPLAQPWSAVVGNSISGLAALVVHPLTLDPTVAVAASAGLTLVAMFLTRSLHPPGGAEPRHAGCAWPTLCARPGVRRNRGIGGRGNGLAPDMWPGLPIPIAV